MSPGCSPPHSVKMGRQVPAVVPGVASHRRPLAHFVTGTHFVPSQRAGRSCARPTQARAPTVVHGSSYAAMVAPSPPSSAPASAPASVPPASAGLVPSPPVPRAPPVVVVPPAPVRPPAPPPASTQVSLGHESPALHVPSGRQGLPSSPVESASVEFAPLFGASDGDEQPTKTPTRTASVARQRVNRTSELRRARVSSAPG